MYHAKGYGKSRSVILATPKTVVKTEVKEEEKKILEEPAPKSEGKTILTEDIATEVVEKVAEDKPKKTTRKKKKAE